MLEGSGNSDTGSLVCLRKTNLHLDDSKIGTNEENSY
jgi:hypothetical protein